MKAKVLIAVVATTLLWGPTTFQAQTPAPKLTVSPDSINFGAHDIGTATSVVAATTLTVSNGRNAAVSLSVSSSGPNTKDFSTSSTCGGTVAAKGQCQITVVFNPVMIANNACAERSATLEFKADTDVVRVQLTGRAYQNLGVSPSIVELPIQRWSSTAAPAAVLLTNYTDAQLESVTVTVNGNFTEDHAGCVKIDPGKSCSIFVTYPPRQSGDAKGVLALTGTIAPAVATTENSGKTEAACPAAPFRRLTTGVVLNGRSYSGWRWWRFDVHSWFLLAISAAFFFSLVLGRWHMIAKPTRAEIIAEVRALRARINADKLSHDSEEKQSRLRQINRLLDAALYPFEYPHFYDPTGTGTGTSIGAKDAGPVSDSLPSTWQRLRHAWFSVPTPTPQFPRWWTRVFDALFWTRGADFASWRLIHEAEREYASLLPLQSVQARLEVAEQELRNMNAPVTVALADRIHQSLSFGDVELLEQEK